MEAYAAWLTAFVAALGLGDDVVVLGHSFGSIVTSAAVASGLRASRLVLVNPIAAPALKGPRGVVTRLAVFYYWAGAALPERSGLAALQSPLVTRFTSLAMVKTHDRGLRRWIHDQHDSYFSRFSDRRVVLDAFRARCRATSARTRPTSTCPRCSSRPTATTSRLSPRSTSSGRSSPTRPSPSSKGSVT